MLRFIAAITIGVILGFRAPLYARWCSEMSNRCFGYFHDELHREENG
jgi:hypothetical protein